MKILYLASEVSPFSKTGGLGDVAAALPAALAARGHDVEIVTPRYGSVPVEGLGPATTPIALQFPFGTVTARFRHLRLADRLSLVFVEEPGFFGGREFFSFVSSTIFFGCAAANAARSASVPGGSS